MKYLGKFNPLMCPYTEWVYHKRVNERYAFVEYQKLILSFEDDTIAYSRWGDFIDFYLHDSVCEEMETKSLWQTICGWFGIHRK